MAKKDKDPGKRVNVNQKIKAGTVRLIGAEGSQVGIVTLDEALRAAVEAGLDLVEVAPEADPPVCRIMDFGRYKYQQSKKQQESRKKATVIQIKEVKLRPKTAEHDYQFKLRNIRKFLSQKNKTKVSLMFRGREIAHAALAKGMLDRIVTDTADLSTVEQVPKLEGRNMTMVLAPK
ncbi:MAG: translation initiation factor IF-3 [Thermodesulfobacteriota bacterium]